MQTDWIVGLTIGVPLAIVHTWWQSLTERRQQRARDIARRLLGDI